RPVLLARQRIQTERDERGEQPRILENDRLDRAAVVFGVDRQRPRRLLTLPVRQRRSRAGRHRTVSRREREPVRALSAKREMPGVEVRLVEVETDTAVERRPPRVDAGGLRGPHDSYLVVIGASSP